jgi:Tfp pilus assembly protein FimT
MKYRLNSRGDTIAEVLISIAVIGLVLAAAYATANRSSLNELDAQQHEIATTIAQTQLELLNNQTTVNLNLITTSGSACFNSSEQLATNTGTYNSAGQLLAGSANYDSTCLVYEPTTYTKAYTVNIIQTSAGEPGDPTLDIPLSTYEVTVTWQGSNVPNKDAVQMFYQPEGTD